MTKIILIGLDGLMPELVERYSDRVPELSALLAEGFFSPALASPYTCTPTNWTTIATGAWVGTHGITSFHVHLPGMELGDMVPSFNSRLCKAEYFWQAAERQGKRCILINYPTAFPLTLTDGVVIGGDGLVSRDWTVRWPEFISSFRQVANCNRLVMQPAGDWTDVPSDCEVLHEGVVDLERQVSFDWGVVGMTPGDQAEPAGAERRFVLVVKQGQTTKLILSRSRSVREALATLAHGEWSGWVEEEFHGSRCLRQYRVVDLTEDGQDVSIYGTMCGSSQGWGYPYGIEQDITARAGPYIEALELVPDQGLTDGWFGPEVALEIMAIQAKFMEDCAAYLSDTRQWDVMFLQCHAPDGINHLLLGELENPDSERGRMADGLLQGTMRILFEMVHAIRIRCADEDTVICVVSDHGNIPVTRYINAHGIMEREGWESWVIDRDTGCWSIDPRRSVALANLRHSGVRINLVGRERYGVVQPGRDYEDLRGRVIDRLRQVVDPLTGQGVFSLVGRREDFEALGMWGDRIPDVLAFAKPYYLFCGAHLGVPQKLMSLYRDPREVVTKDEAVAAGAQRELTAVHWHLPSASVGYASNRAMLILTGPGLARGKRGERVNLVDVSATLAHLMGIHPPAQCEGRLIEEALVHDRG